jgi:hypothetical protein
MNSINVQQPQPQFTYHNTASSTVKRKRLVSQWIKVDGKLICQWITTES